MEQTQYIVAIEIGSSKIVGAIAEKSQSGYVQVTHLEEERLTNSVRYGCIQNVENTKGAINKILKKLENGIDGTINDVYVGISGRSLHSEVDDVNRNLDNTRPITDDILEKIIRDAGKDPVKNYETVDIVPRAYYVDNSHTPNPSGQYGNNINIKVNLIVAKPLIKTNLSRALSSITHIKGYMVTPLVVAEEILEDRERKLGVMLVDVGAETTTVSIYKEGRLLYLTTLPLGGRNITLDVATGMNTLEETAERVKKNINMPLSKNVEVINIDGVKSDEAANYIKARTGEIASNINAQLEYAGVTATDLNSIVLIGGGSQLQGFADFLSETTKLRVRPGSYPHTLNILDHSINRHEYIEVFSLLAKAAEVIPDGQSCVERHIYDDGPALNVETEPARKPEPETVQPKKPQQKSPKKGTLRAWLEEMRKKAEKFASEDTEM